MSFQAKRLRVQLPCDPGGTVIEEGAQEAAAGLCRVPSLCAFPTNCLWGSGCHIGTIACHDFITDCRLGFLSHCRAASCGIINATFCDMNSCGFGSPCTISIPQCIGGSRQPGPDPGPIIIDAEHLPALREALEAQLKEIEKAEQALEERGGEGKK